MKQAAKQSVVVHLDLPPGGVVTGAVSVVHGWLAAEGSGSFEHAHLVSSSGITLPLAFVDRPDVRTAQRGRATVGFSGWIDARRALDGPWSVRVEFDGRTHQAPVTLLADAADARAFAAAKDRKLARIRPLLRCPACRAPLDRGLPKPRCVNGHTFGAARDAFDMRDADLRSHLDTLPLHDVSAHGYDASLLELIARSEGPILDAGAGLRPDYREDVVNLEILPYPTTDVISSAERLPFADATFDVVISVAVLEHVRDPFAAARELERALRPGGHVFAAVPFLQPYHAYPNHYYNMTADGLKNLFAACEVERLEVPASGRPIFLLTWMLHAWRSQLPADVAREFEQMRVADLAVDPMTLVDRPFVRELSEAANVQLAALNVLIARKRG